MTKSIPESFSLAECLKLYSDQIPAFIYDKLEQLVEEQVALKTEITASDRSYEIMSEQVGAARDLISNISNYVDNDMTRSPKAIRQHIRGLIENSYFEM